MTEVLTTQGMTKQYGKVVVLRDVSFDLVPGEIHALLGANGAGKSTLCKMIAGLTSVTSGTMRLRGQAFAPTNKQAAETAGVQIIQQELNLLPTLSVAENLFLSDLPNTGGLIRRKQLHQDATSALARLGLEHLDPSTPVGHLGVGQQQMVEIAAALARQCRVLILDEPTAALSGSETTRLFEQLTELKQRGVGMIYISHRLDEIKQIAERITVLRDGRYVCTRDVRSTSTDEMVDLMSGVGPDASSAPPHQFHSYIDQNKPPVLRVDQIHCGPVRHFSFEVKAGEKFGITGLVGSGRTELLRAIFGADVASSGTVKVADRPPQRFEHPRQAIASGLAMVTEDRKDNGLLLPQPIRSNITLASLRKRFSNFSLIRRRAEEHTSEDLCVRLQTKCTSIEQPVGTLSGGNQQKVVISKWLANDADVFLFDEPTRGIDVGARRRIYQLLDEIAASGKGIVIVSSDLDELFETCDTIAVMNHGHLIRTFSRDQWSEDLILQASFEMPAEVRA
ncbi:sugar ABC transporter ATP-binding protein [Roseiconus lacunae]|uniref:sugar ABC transporter ATP-binding protein n=1 Tax=Roseiconus lacunae TaxID=2605694 RepID=UPI001F482821|nr:sugar ABC transporter ATP-binding protein [Roseiconus lacunae]